LDKVVWIFAGREPRTTMTTPPPPSGPPSRPEATAEAWTVRRVLEWTTQHLKKHGSETPRLDAEILLAKARHCRRIELYAGYDETLSDEVRATMRELVSLDFRVTADVLIPRPDTETLVVEALTLLKTQTQPRVLDLCTGSGCIAVAIAKNCTPAEVTAIDISPAALAIAQENATKHGVQDRIAFLQGDLFAPLGERPPFDVIVSNPPYVASEEMAGLSADVRKHEPHLALDGGPGGFRFLDLILRTAPTHLVQGGTVLVELSPEQAEPIAEKFQATGSYAEVRIQKDLAQQGRVVMAKKR